jgi:transaldolase
MLTTAPPWRQETAMNAPAKLNGLGQSLWLDNITRDLLDSGTLARYIADLSVTGLTSNPTIYDKAIGSGSSYDEDVRAGAAGGLDAEGIFFELALADLRRAADLFRPVHDRTLGVDGFVSLEVSPLLADDAEQTKEWAARLHAAGGRPNLFIKIPGTPAGLAAIEETIFAGVPVNVTLLFSVEQYRGCMDAYTRGIERRVAAGLPAYVASVASVFVSRWDGATASKLPPELKNRLGLAIGRAAYAEYRSFIASDRWQRLANVGARPQRLLFASTGTKDPAESDTLYIGGLAAPNTVNTMPEDTLLAFADHGEVDSLLDPDMAHAVDGLARFEAAGIDIDALGAELQAKGAASFVDSWASLVRRIEEKAAAG